MTMGNRDNRFDFFRQGWSISDLMAMKVHAKEMHSLTAGDEKTFWWDLRWATHLELKKKAQEALIKPIKL